MEEPKLIIEEEKPLRELYFQLSQNKGALIGLYIIIFALIIAIIGPLIAPWDPYAAPRDMDLNLSLSPAWADGGQFRFFLGTDDIGRDVLSRLLYGTRISIGVAFLVVLFSTVTGTFIGLISGYVGKKLDIVVMRFVDIIMAMPSILLALVIVAVLGRTLTNTAIAVSLVGLPRFIRIARAAVMTEKNKQYVTASKSFGASHFRILFVNILPNCAAPLTVQATLAFSDGILDIAALGFLGLGVQGTTPEWGKMLADAREHMEAAPWMVTLPGLCILIVVLGFNLLGDGLRDALDPRLKK